MPKSFAITTTAVGPLRVDAKGHAQAVFTVTNTTARPIRGLARIKPLGDTKREWLSIEGEAERDFAAMGTHQFAVNFNGPGAVAPGSSTAENGAAALRQLSFRLDVVSTQNPDEDFTEGPTVSVQMSGPESSPEKFPRWILFIILGALLLVGGVVLIVVLATRGGENHGNTNESETSTTVATPTPSPSPTEAPEITCINLIQGRIAWNYSGDKNWTAENIKNLCRSTTNPSQPGECFRRVMFGGVSWGSGTRWNTENALNLCAGANDADRRISCFQGQIDRGVRWENAITSCSRE